MTCLDDDLGCRRDVGLRHRWSTALRQDPALLLGSELNNEDNAITKSDANLSCKLQMLTLIMRVGSGNLRSLKEWGDDVTWRLLRGHAHYKSELQACKYVVAPADLKVELPNAVVFLRSYDSEILTVI